MLALVLGAGGIWATVRAVQAKRAAIPVTLALKNPLTSVADLQASLAKNAEAFRAQLQEKR